LRASEIRGPTVPHADLVPDFARKGELNPGYLTLPLPHNFFLVIGTGL
jgi:hypothetical protein